ncbi:hypothetical protein QE152_g27052 [Popillia japonica]|uniref:Uncharacterized protein n=1 Tax=Popillia japonica TaxID=7064 RepID=A0AAW1JWV2_POPJA
MFNINVRSVYLLTNLAVPHLIKSQGIIESAAAVCTLNGSSGYMKKSALEYFTNMCNLRIGSQKKECWIGWQCCGGFNEDGRWNAGRVGNVDDITQVVVYFTNDERDFVTGQCFLLDGGLSISSPTA